MVYQGSTLNNGGVGVSYSANIGTATGSNSITYTLKPGSSLPDGLVLDQNLIHGTPTTAGTTQFVIIADSENAEASVEATFTIVVMDELVGPQTYI
ncbi:MAG: putative Ig domain-containing protein, partial [Acholeplasmataceae bacterium]